MNSRIRDATPEDAPAVSDLVHASFRAHVATDWESLAQESLIADTSAEKLSARIIESILALVHEEAGSILGVILMPRPNLVQLCFVAPGHLRKGIGRSLWNASCIRLMARYPEVRTVELNSSPYAVAAYKALGFYPISAPFNQGGAVATRMACWLPGMAYGVAPNAATARYVERLATESPLSVMPLLHDLQSLEVELHHPGVRCNRERLNQLLHPDFHEVGRSGRSYSRETIVSFLAAQETQPVVASEAFSVAELGPGVALLTYRSAHLERGNILVHHTLRSSIWVKTNEGWRLRYHQGTAAAETW